MKAIAKQVRLGRLMHCSFGEGGASLWIRVLLMMCNLLLCRFGSNVGAELSRDGQVLLNFSSVSMEFLGECQGDVASWNTSDDTPCGWVRVFCTRESVVHRLDFSACSVSVEIRRQLHILRDLGSLQELDLSSNPGMQFDFLYFKLESWPGLTWLDISGSWAVLNYTEFGPKPRDDLSGLRSLQYLYAKGGLFSTYFPAPMPFLEGLRELVVLSLAQSGVAGGIREEVGNLTKLVSLDLSYNFLQGSFPNLDGLTRLTRLSLTSNNLSGEVPAAPNLQYLDAAQNSFTNLTTSVFQMSALKRVNLSGNQLREQLPDIIGIKFPRLQVLDLSWNGLQGHIVSGLGNVTHLDLSHNNLSGPIPLDIRIYPSVGTDGWVDLSGNELNGTIPAPLLYGASWSTYVNLSRNSLVGDIPEAPLRLKKHHHRSSLTLDLSDNRLNGSIPSSLCNYMSIKILWLQNNNLSGDLILLLWGTEMNQVMALPTSIRVQGNRFTGDLTKLLDTWAVVRGDPSRIDEWDLNSRIVQWDLSHNNFKMIPSEKFPHPLPRMLEMFCNISPKNYKFHDRYSLEELRLAGSDLMGQPLPDSFNCSGPISTEPGKIRDYMNLNSLQVLDLASCNLSGTVPESLFKINLRNLTFLNVSNNRLCGTIPERLPVTLRVLDLGTNKLSGPLPGTFPLSLQVLDVSHNNLNGEIPGLPTLLHFNASNNKLSGRIPDSFPVTLKVLDISRNNLTGEIPGTLFSRLSNLGYINLSGNNLSGPIPDNIPPALYNASFFADNPGLCGGPLKPCTAPQPLAPTVQQHAINAVTVLVLVVGGAVLLCTASCSCLFSVWRWRVYSKKHQQDADLIATLLERETVTVMPLRKLRRATSNFSESAQIGFGGFGTVYSGKLADGTAVAIKKSKREGSPEYKQQFLNEVKILSGVNHRHLGKLLGCSMENKIALLVFEFIPNGTLKEHLQGKRQGFPPLSWSQRLLIALQTSDALAYLHSAADPPIIHRDVKSSNILLDDDLNAKVADFGISKLAPSKAATHVSTVAIQGTWGYIDPEYYATFQLTPRSDVYSFGVVLLELISAKTAVNFGRGYDEATLANLALSARERGEWEQLIDAVLADTYSLANGKASIDNVGALAVRCLASRSRERPEMKEVRNELQTLWLHWNSDDSLHSDHVRHSVEPQNGHGDVDASYDCMSPQRPHASPYCSASTSRPEIEMQHL